MSEGRIILPLERALKEEYQSRDLTLPERNGRDIVLQETPGLMSSYSTKEYPPYKGCDELLRLSRAITVSGGKKGSLDFCAGLMHDNGVPAILVTVVRNQLPEREVYQPEFAQLKNGIQIMRKLYNKKKGEELTPQLLRKIARDYIEIANYAFSLISKKTETD